LTSFLLPDDSDDFCLLVSVLIVPDSELPEDFRFSMTGLLEDEPDFRSGLSAPLMRRFDGVMLEPDPVAGLSPLRERLDPSGEKVLPDSSSRVLVELPDDFDRLSKLRPSTERLVLPRLVPVLSGKMAEEASVSKPRSVLTSLVEPRTTSWKQTQRPDHHRQP